jgi:hypothetical protein
VEPHLSQIYVGNDFRLDSVPCADLDTGSFGRFDVASLVSSGGVQTKPPRKDCPCRDNFCRNAFAGVVVRSFCHDSVNTQLGLAKLIGVQKIAT